jgi:signal transduction histidine kinase
VGPSDRSRGRGNLHLEVAIADRVATLHGGSLEISSAGPDHGARYRLRLPL